MITFDLETTGFDAEQDNIIEVGFVVHNEHMKKVDEGGCLVQPGQEIPEDVVSLTGITNEDVQKDGYPWPAVRERMRPYFESEAIWCAHNASFDIGFLEAHFDDCPSYEHVVDTMRIAERFVPEASNKLGDLAHFFGVSLQNAHRAVEDASATADLLKMMLSDLDLEIEDLLDSKPVKLGKYHIGEDPMEALYSGLSNR